MSGLNINGQFLIAEAIVGGDTDFLNFSTKMWGFDSEEQAKSSLVRILQKVKELDPSMFTKSGIMVGLGEERQGVMQVMDDMRAADIDFLTIGQYLQPTPKHHAVARFVTPDEFKAYEKAAYGKGFHMVSATPLTRSSYHAGDDFEQLRAARFAALGKT